MRVNPALAAMPAQYLFARIEERVRLCEAADPARPVLRLGIGDVTRPLGPHVAGAFGRAAAAMGTAQGFRGYAPAAGYAFLREAIWQNEYAGCPEGITPDDIFVSEGAKQDTAALEQLFGPDVRVAVTPRVCGCQRHGGPPGWLRGRPLARADLPALQRAKRF